MDYDIDYLLSNTEYKDILIETRNALGMNRKEFAEYFKIPYRTVQDWELGKRQMPEYLLRLILFRAFIEMKTTN